jgi:hypothetical protein
VCEVYTYIRTTGITSVRIDARPLHLAPGPWPPGNWSFPWFGPEHFGTDRAQIESGLKQLPGKQLVIVHYQPDHNLLDEWVYNSADIDGSKVVWARVMDAVNNLELIHCYGDRKVWLVEPDEVPVRISPYPMPGLESEGAH